MGSKSEQLLSFINQQCLEVENQKQALSNILRKMLVVLNCDRAWCLYPCEPETEYWGIPIEHTRYEWPGVKHVELDIPTTEEEKTIFNIHLASNGPVTFGKDADYPIPDYLQKIFSLKSLISSAIYQNQGKPWMLGIHFCDNHHHLSDDELKFFDLVRKKIASAFYNISF